MLPQRLPLELMQTKWASELNPVLANPLTNPTLLQGIVLKNGATSVNHMLGRQMIGWFIADLNASATIYRSQPMNDKTLTLTSSAAVTVNLVVF